MSSAYAQVVSTSPTCAGCTMEDAKSTTADEISDDVGVSISTERKDYGHDDMIVIEGQVANVAPGFPVTITVLSPLNFIVTIESLDVSQDGYFVTTLNTAGDTWKYDGIYTIKATYGSAERSNSVQVKLTGGVGYIPNYSTAEVQEKLDEIEKINLENEYLPKEREWITSGPFQIDRSEYAIGEKIFLNISGLQLDEVGQVAFLRPFNNSHYEVYQIIPFDGSQKSAFNYYLEPQISADVGIYSIRDLVGEWVVRF